MRVPPLNDRGREGLVKDAALARPARVVTRGSANRFLSAGVWTLVALVAVLDFWTPAALLGSILFTFPLALCATAQSKRLLWSTAAVAVSFTTTAHLWGINRVEYAIPWDAILSRGLLVVSLLTLTIFIHLWLSKNEEVAADAEQIARQSDNLVRQNEHLQALIAEAAREIVARKQAETSLAGLESRARGLLEAAPDAILVVDADGKITLLNAQAEKLYGYERAELLGLPSATLTPERMRQERRELRAAFNADPRSMIMPATTQPFGLRKDGSEFPLEAQLSPFQTPDGLLIVAAVRDITARKGAEKKMSQMEGRYRGLLEAAPDAMVLVNKVGDIVLVNRQTEKMFGYDRKELVGSSARKLAAAESIERLAASTRRVDDGTFAEQTHTAIDLDGCHKDGSLFPMEVTLSSLATTDEGILLSVAIRDVTVRKQGEARLMQMVAELDRSNEELSQFAYIASHDLQEPLRMVTSYTQLLSKRYAGKLGPDADEFIAFAVDGAERMQRLIKDLLAYSHVGTKGKELAKTSSEEALEGALMNLGGAIEDSGALVTHDPLPDVLADERQLVQLFQNLVGNGIKYQSGGVPLIHVSSIKESQTKWMFSVRDNGLGIEPRYFERIFGMFQRLHRRDEFDGTGIGLAICKKIVERHGGSISVESTLGQGSTFSFSLSNVTVH